MPAPIRNPPMTAANVLRAKLRYSAVSNHGEFPCIQKS